MHRYEGRRKSFPEIKQEQMLRIFQNGNNTNSNQKEVTKKHFRKNNRSITNFEKFSKMKSLEILIWMEILLHEVSETFYGIKF